MSLKKKKEKEGWKDGWAGKSTWCSCRRPEFGSHHHMLGGSYLPIILVPWTLTPFSGFCGHLHTCSHIHMRTHTKKNSKLNLRNSFLPVSPCMNSYTIYTVKCSRGPDPSSYPHCTLLPLCTVSFSDYPELSRFFAVSHHLPCLLGQKCSPLPLPLAPAPSLDVMQAACISPSACLII